MAIAAPARGGSVGVTEKGPIRHLDPVLILTTIGLSIYGLLMVYSSTRRSLEQLGTDPGFYVKKQVAYLFLGVIALIVVASFDYRLVKVYAPFFFGGVLFFLLIVMIPFIGTSTAGAQRWITIFGFQFQPSELAKLALVAMLAAYLSEVKGELTLRDVMRSAGLAALPMGLVFLQPDVGTTMVFAAILVGLLLVAGARARHLAILALAAAIAVAGAFQTGLVKDYQIARLIGLFDTKADPLRAGYNKKQSEIAIGNGGVTGQGYLKGTQTNLDFVPEQHTDFIFTVVGEEFGFVGAMILLLLFALLLWRGFRVALLSKDPFGTYLATGIVTMLAFQSFVNIGMTLGIMPITGIPLPFLSYGGSALITDFIAVGLLLNVHMRRFK